MQETFKKCDFCEQPAETHSNGVQKCVDCSIKTKKIIVTLADGEILEFDATEVRNSPKYHELGCTRCGQIYRQTGLPVPGICENCWLDDYAEFAKSDDFPH